MNEPSQKYQYKMPACAASAAIQHRISVMAVKKPAGSVEVQRKKVKIQCLGTNQNKISEKRQKNCERSYSGDNIAKTDPN